MYWHWRDYTWSRQCPRGRPRRGTRRRWKKASSGPPSQARLGPRIPDPGRGHAAWVKRVRCMPHKPWNRPSLLHRLYDSHPQAPAAVPGALWWPPVSCGGPWARQWQGRSSTPICNCHGVRFQGCSASGIQSCRPPWFQSPNVLEFWDEKGSRF